MEIFLVFKTEVLLASGGLKPGKLLKTLQCTGQSLLPTKNYLAHYVNSENNEKPLYRIKLIFSNLVLRGFKDTHSFHIFLVQEN